MTIADPNSYLVDMVDANRYVMSLAEVEPYG
ncbi:hypothetical protein QFZ78_003575 [Paenibacillus sp. V4I5]|nr:hypothetical protein [Paenibacillus sp. V4I5]